MKAVLIASIIAVSLLAASNAQAFPLIADWGFEVVTPADSTDAAANGPHAADGGANAGSSSASGSHASALTDWTTPAGNGSVNSYSSNNWTSGDNYQFCTSTVGYSSITLDWDQTGSSTGPRDFVLQYNVNGGSYSDVGGTYAVLLNGAPNAAWSSGGGVQAVYHFGPVALPALADNQTEVCVRMTNNSTVAINLGTVAAGGTGRVDNVQINGVPEPTTLSLLALGALALIRRRR